MTITKSVSPLASALDGRDFLLTEYGIIWEQALKILVNVAGYAFVERFSSCPIRFRLRGIPTAAIMTNFSEIFVNPQFFLDNIDSPEDFAALLLHEMFHSFVDPTGIHIGPLWNIVQDILINSLVTSLSPELGKFFQKCYPDTYPESLLRSETHKTLPTLLTNLPELSKLRELVKDMAPPQIAQTINELLPYKSTYGKTYDQNKKTEFFTNIGWLPITILQINTYDSLYSKEETSMIDVYRIKDIFFPGITQEQQNGSYKIKRADGSEINPEDLPMTISNIPGQSDQEIEAAEKTEESKALNKKLNEQAETKDQKDKKSSKSKQAGKDGEVSKYKVILKNKTELKKNDALNSSIIWETVNTLNRSSREFKLKSVITHKFPNILKDINNYSPAKAVEAAFKNSALMDIRNSVVNAMAFEEQRTRTPLPIVLPKRAMVSLAMGYLPQMYQKSRRIPIPNDPEKSRVYIDVSGSFMEHIPWTLGLISQMEHRCKLEDIYVFSTYVRKTSIDEVKRGEYESSGGTSFNAVLTDFTQSTDSKCLIITDGYDSVDKDLLEKMKAQRKQTFVLVISSSPQNLNFVNWATKSFNYVVE